MTNGKLNGKVAIVTGASSGIGEATAIAQIRIGHLEKGFSKHNL